LLHPKAAYVRVHDGKYARPALIAADDVVDLEGLGLDGLCESGAAATTAAAEAAAAAAAALLVTPSSSQAAAMMAMVLSS